MKWGCPPKLGQVAQAKYQAVTSCRGQTTPSAAVSQSSSTDGANWFSAIWRPAGKCHPMNVSLPPSSRVQINEKVASVPQPGG